MKFTLPVLWCTLGSWINHLPLHTINYIHVPNESLITCTRCTSCTSYCVQYRGVCTFMCVHNVTSYKLQVLQVLQDYKLPGESQVTRFFCLFTKYT